MRFRVPRATAAMMLLAQMSAQPMPAMAQGGPAPAGSPVLVGERGPEVFVPNRPGRVVPLGATEDSQWLKEHPWWGATPTTPETLPGALGADLGFNAITRSPSQQYPTGTGSSYELSPDGRVLEPARPTAYEAADVLGRYVRAVHWDNWFESRPESVNVEDLRTPEERARDNELMLLQNWNVAVPRTRTPDFRTWRATAPRGEWKHGKGDRWKPGDTVNRPWNAEGVSALPPLDPSDELWKLKAGETKIEK